MSPATRSGSARQRWPLWTLLVAIPFVAHAAWAWSRGSFRWETGLVLAVLLALLAAGQPARRLLLGVYPLGLVGLLYDSMRVVERVGVTASTVHLCDLRERELALFGIPSAQGRVTLHDWFVAHPSAWLDDLCAIPYATFIFVCVACAVWLYVRDYHRMRRFAWCFLALNVAGFVTYHLYPAAPPWYFHAHGCAVDLQAHASAGAALTRVDSRLGIPFFAGMYGRASDVFGAMPSLHCAYALLVLLEGWATFGVVLRAAATAFFASMCFAAVYLDHHWVLDVLGGVTYCVAVVCIARAVSAALAGDPRAAEVASPPVHEEAT